MATIFCGCDPDFVDTHGQKGHLCERHQKDCDELDRHHAAQPPILQNLIYDRPAGLPTTDAARKALPIFDGVLMYFPLAIAEVARVSQVGNDQHNPGQPLHWDRTKSRDQRNTCLRHLIDDGMGNHRDTDGTYHLAKAAWRALAALELQLEAERQA